MQTKYCPECEKDKLPSDFHDVKSRHDGLSGYCKECTSEKHKIYNSTPERKNHIKEYNKTHKKKSIKIDNNNSGRRFDRVKTTAYKSKIKHKYGLTIEQVNKMWMDQKGLCIICEKPFLIYKEHIDHCHTTKKVRGLLCSYCNMGLGHFFDSPELLKKAACYLEKQ